MGLTGTLLMDGTDCWTAYGISMDGTNNALLAFPERKDSLSFNYTDQDGLSIDLTAPAFKARQMKLSFWLMATNSTTFWTQYQSWFSALTSPGSRSIFISELQSTVSLFYVGTDSLDKVTPITGNTTGVYMKMVLNFSETIPVVVRGTAAVAVQATTVGMSGYIGRDGLLWLRWGWNYKNLDGLMAVVGDSQYQGVTGASHNPPGKLRDKIQAWQAQNHPNATFSDIAMGGLGSIQMVPDGDNTFIMPAHNISEALRSNPDIVILGDTSNDFTSPLHADMPGPPPIPPEQVTANKLRIKQYCETFGIPCFVVSLYPRGSYDTYTRGLMNTGWTEELAAFTDGSYVNAWPQLVTQDGQYNLLSQYDIGDATHLNDAGNTVMLGLITQVMNNRLGVTSGIAAYEITYSTDQSTWYTLDTVTDQNVVKKQYPAPAAGNTWYRFRSKSAAGVYSAYSPAALVANNGYPFAVIFFMAERQRLLPVGVACIGDPYTQDYTFTDPITGISLSTKKAQWGGFGTGGTFDFNGAQLDDGGGYWTGYASAQRTCWFTENQSSPTTLYFAGLNPANQYSIYLFSGMDVVTAASINTDNTMITTVFSVNSVVIGQQIAPGNTSKPLIYNFTPNPDGTLQVVMSQLKAGGLMCITAIGFKITATPAQMPVSNAGAQQNVTLPASTVSLNGGASTATLGYITTWKWEKTVGGAVTMPNTGASLCQVSGLTEDTYQFKLTVTNSYGYSSASYVTVIVSPSGGPSTTKFAFSKAGYAVPGFVNCAGDPSVADQSFTDSATGITIKTTHANWNAFNGVGAIDGNGMSTGNNSGRYPDATERNFWIAAYILQATLSGFVANSSNRIRFYAAFNAATGAYYSGGSPISFAVNGSVVGTVSDITSNTATIIEAFGTADANGIITIAANSSSINAGVLNVLEIQKAPAAGVGPTANAGQTQYISGSSATLNGSLSSSGGTGSSYQSTVWTMVSGDSGAVISNPNTPVTTVNGLLPGTNYLFKYTVQNSSGYTSYATVQVQVWPAGTARTWNLGFGTQGEAVSAGWNVFNLDPASAGTGTYSFVHPALKWVFSFNSSDFAVIGSGTAVAAGTSTGNNSGFAPDSILGQYWYSGSAKTADLYINMGTANANKAVVVQIMGGISTQAAASLGGASGSLVTYYVNGVSIGQLNTYNNTANFVQSASSMTTDASGILHIQSIGNQSGSTQFGMYNAIKVTLL